MTRTLLCLALLIAPLGARALACPCNEKKAACDCSGGNCPSSCTPDDATKQPDAKKGDRASTAKK